MPCATWVFGFGSVTIGKGGSMELGDLFIPIMVLIIILTVIIAGMLLARNYIKVAPNEVAVFSGRKRTLPDGKTVGYRIVKGGASLRIPLLEKVDYLSLNVLTIPLEIKRAYTLMGVPVSVKAVANVKIKSDDVSLQAAAERFLGVDQDEMHKVIFQTLEGHLRSILGTLTVEEINGDRQSFAQKLTSEAAVDLERMGIGVDVLTIQEISDEHDYLDSLGKKRTAEVKRDAEIGKAEADRDAKIRSSLAYQEGEKVRLEAEANIAQAQRDLEIKKAKYLAEIESERARAEQAGPLARAQAQQAVVAEEVKVERVRTQEQISVQEQEVQRKSRELEATVERPAEAQKNAAILKAEAAKQAAILEAEGKKQALIAIAEAEQERLKKEGLGRAAAIEAEGKAEAAKIEAIGLAQAKAIEAQGLAEAAAILKKADAWKQFNEAARLQTVLEKLPSILQASTGIFGAVAAPLGNIDKVVVIEQGNGGQSGVTRFANNAPTLIFNLLQQLQALGLNLPEIMNQLGITQANQPAATAPAGEPGGSTS